MNPPTAEAPTGEAPPEQAPTGQAPTGQAPSKEAPLEEGASRKSKNRIERESATSYNPFEHREVPRPTSDIGALAHLLKTSLGSGILAMPMAYRNAGLVVGAVGTVILGIICTHCVYLLVKSSQVLCKRIRVPALDFSKTAEVAFETGPPAARKIAKTAKIIITIELLLSFILGNTVYVVFISQSINQVIDYYFSPNIDIRFYILMLWPFLILMCMSRNLKSLVPFSILANIFVVISFGITLYYIFREVNDTSSVNLAASIDRLPLFLSTVIFAIEGIGTVLPIENEMKHPQHFLDGRCGVMYIAMTVVVTLYGIIGFFGYLEYGNKTEGSITLNLPTTDIMAQMVKILIALAIFFTYALQFYVPINIVWDMLKEKVPERHHLYYNTGVRIGLVSMTIFGAIIIPRLETIISLVGAVCFAMLGLFLPAVIDTVTRWPALGFWWWMLYKNIFIIFVSIVALMSGTYGSVLQIIETYE